MGSRVRFPSGSPMFSITWSGAVSPTARSLRMTQIVQGCHGSGRDFVPLGHSGRAAGFIVVAADEMSVLVEVVVESGVNGTEFL